MGKSPYIRLVTIPKKCVDAVSDELGYDVDIWWVEQIWEEFKDAPLVDLISSLDHLEALFARVGGRDPEMGDSIDTLKAALELRACMD